MARGSKPSRPGKLSDADRQLWERITRTVTPKPPAPVPASRMRGAFANAMRIKPPAPSDPAPTPGPLEATRAKAVRRGRVEVQARVDLHDMTLAAAYPELARTLIRAYNRNLRTVLVITGKGRMEAGRHTGRIRAALPGWLAGAELRTIVATYAPAHARHGGAGAWYVFLKQAGDQ